MRPDPIREAVRAVVCIAMLAAIVFIAVWGFVQTLDHPPFGLTH